jgi:hypothetical protein
MVSAGDKQNGNGRAVRNIVEAAMRNQVCTHHLAKPK